MIKCIVAIDSQRGMANDQGIPWHLPTDLKYFRQKTINGAIFMGYRTYAGFDKPFHKRINYVAIPDDVELKPGFKRVPDARKFLKDFEGDIWVIGGAGLIKTIIDLIDELYITQIQADFHCTKFLPEYKHEFEIVSDSLPQTENGTTFTFQVWQRKPAA